MLRILIIANNVANSPITWKDENRGPINRLPEKLQVRVLEVANKLSESNISKLEYGDCHFVLSQRDKNYTIDSCPDFLNDDFLVSFTETIKSLYWYLGPHLCARDPDLLGGSIICCDCGHTQQRSKPFALHCEFAGCPSHARWAEVIEEYEPPKYLSDETLANVVQKLQGSNRGSTESLQTDDANKWIQKG